MPNAYNNMPALIAHRGASAFAPENTAAAIILAAQLGATWCEVDVTISADGIAVIHHDADLERCSNGQGLVIQHTLANLKQLDAGSWFDAKYHQQRILTLSELLIIAKHLNLGLNLEIKPTIGREKETVQAMLVALEQITTHQPILLSSFNVHALYEAKTQLPYLTRALNVEAIPYNWQQRLTEVDAQGLHFQLEFFNQTDVSDIRAAGFNCAIFTVNDANTAQELFDAGVNAVFSDYPNLFKTPFPALLIT